MMHMIKAVDRRLLWLNLLLLLAVVFIPFPAYLLGRHFWNPLAAAVYGLNLMTVNALGTLLWFYASSRPGIISDGISPRAIRFIGEAGILWFGLVVFSAENQAFSSEN